jgi:hypothetical protein
METAVWLRLAGLVCGMTFGFLLAQSGLGALAPLVFAGCLFLGVLAGEVTLPRPERTVSGSAALEVRRVRDYLPQPAARGVLVIAATFGGLLGLLAVTGFVGRGGGLYVLGMSGWYQKDSFPGFGALAGYPPAGLLISTVLTVSLSVALAAIVLRLLVRSPRSGAEADQRGRDEAWRRRTARTITATAGIVVSLALSALGLGAAWAVVAGYGPGALLGATLLAATGALALVAFAGYTSMLISLPAGTRLVGSTQAGTVTPPSTGPESSSDLTRAGR